jgi:hypothetical protein
MKKKFGILVLSLLFLICFGCSAVMAGGGTDDSPLSTQENQKLEMQIKDVDSLISYWNERMKWGLSDGEIEHYSDLAEKQLLSGLPVEYGYYIIPDMDEFCEEMGRLIGLNSLQISAFIREKREQRIIDEQNYLGRVVTGNGTSSSGNDQPISITITSPGNGTEFYNDVAPPRLRVMANISSEYEIKKVTIDSGWELVEADSSKEIDVYIHVDGSGTKSIVVTAWDEKGNSVSETTTFTIITGPPPPPEYTVQYTLYGRVTDSTDEPIQGCQVMINSTVWSTRSNVPLGSTNMTDINGSYLIENVYGPKLMITADKEGYQQYQNMEGFNTTSVEFNIVMIPKEKESPGFVSFVGISGIAVAFCLMSAGRRSG